MRRVPTSRQLPVIFQALDLEGKTKPVPTLVCPVRGDVMTVGNCGRCRDFRRVEFTEDSRPVLCCSTDHIADQPIERVQDLLRVPVVCTAPDTVLALVAPYLATGTNTDAIPVLDSAARPVGFVSIREMQRCVVARLRGKVGLSRHFVLSQPMTWRAPLRRRRARDKNEKGCCPLPTRRRRSGALHPTCERLRRELAEKAGKVRMGMPE